MQWDFLFSLFVWETLRFLFFDEDPANAMGFLNIL